LRRFVRQSFGVISGPFLFTLVFNLRLCGLGLLGGLGFVRVFIFSNVSFSFRFRDVIVKLSFVDNLIGINVMKRFFPFVTEEEAE
jgi:hypothetical protein